MLIAPYADLAALKRRMQITQADKNSDLEAALMAASVAITNETGRRYELENDRDARTFRAGRSGWTCRIDDLTIADSDGVDQAPTVTTATSGRDQTYTAHSGVVITNDIQRSGVVDLLEGDTYAFPTGRGAWVKVTPATTSQGWGWGHVPAPIVEATLMLANRYHKRRNTPEGVVGFEGAGVGRIANRDMDVMELIRPYCRIEKWVP